MDEFTRTLLDTDGQTLCDFILFCKRMNCAPTAKNWTWFLARRDAHDNQCFLTQAGKFQGE